MGHKKHKKRTFRESAITVANASERTCCESAITVLNATAGAAAWQEGAIFWDNCIQPFLGMFPYAVSYYGFRSIFLAFCDVSGNLAMNFVARLIAQLPRENTCKTQVINAVNAATWQPVVDAGVKLGQCIFHTAKTASPLVVTVAGVGIFGWNWAATYALKYVLSLDSPALLTNALADLGFYLPGPLSLPGSGSGNRSMRWIPPFVLVAAATGEGLSWLVEKCRGTGNEEQTPLLPLPVTSPQPR